MLQDAIVNWNRTGRTRYYRKNVFDRQRKGMEKRKGEIKVGR